MKTKITKLVPITIAFILSILSFVLFPGCNTTEPPPPPPEKPKVISLKLITQSCTEMFLTVSAKDTILPARVTIKRDGKEVMNFYQTKGDTTVIDTGLTAGKTYTYQPIAELNGKEEAGKEIQVTTLDTTSNNFTWQTFTFGDPRAGSSTLNDVAIINENDIYAVGEIYMNDSTGKADLLPYSIAHWNGTRWELKKLYDTNNQLIPSIRGIYYFSSSNIWLADGGVYHWNGVSQKVSASYDRISLIGGTENGQSINKLWGTSSSNLYGIGWKGMITHYNGTSWQKIESGTTTNINDIWGIHNAGAGTTLILATVSSRYERGDYKLLSISGNTSKEYFSWPYTRLYGIWFDSPQEIYIVGDGAYVYKNNRLKAIKLPTNNFLTRVRGNALNDIYIATSGALIFHYNGINWKKMSDGINGSYEGMDVKDNTVVLVGFNVEGGMVGKAVITVGKR